MYTKNIFRSVSSSFHSKNRLNKAFDVLCEKIEIDKMARFASRYYIILCHNLDQYENRKITKNRIIGACFFRLCSFITGLRYLLSASVNKKWMTIMMADANYMISNQRLFSSIFCLAAFVILFIGLLLQLNEMEYKFTLLDFLIAWKNKTLLGLNARNTKKLVLIINLMVNLLMKQAFWPLVFACVALLIGPSLVAYFDKESGFLVVPIIFFSFCLFIWSVQFICIVCAGFVAWSVPFFYLKFKFQEIHQEIQSCIQTNNQTQLSESINDHQTTCLQVEAINNVFKFVVFVLYYFGSPALMTLLYVSHARETIPIARPICAFILVLVYFVVFYLNLVSAQISHSAAKPRKLLYKYLINNQMPITMRFKIYKFIAKLSGPDIGFYCWDIFAMNNHTFAKYLGNCAYSYILILDLYNKIK